MSQELQVRAFFDPACDCVAIYARDGEKVAVSVDFEPREPGAFVSPLLRLATIEAQKLMDDLWNCGLRPVAGKQSEGAIAAQAHHLADMRAIAFAKLNISTPPGGSGRE